MGGYVRDRNSPHHFGPWPQATVNLKSSRDSDLLSRLFLSHTIYKKQIIKTLQFSTYEERLLFSSWSTFSFLNSCTQLLKYQFCHANALFDSKFYHRKTIKKKKTEDTSRKVTRDKVIFIIKVQERCLSSCRERWASKKICLSLYEESNLRPLDSALRCSTAEPQRLNVDEAHYEIRVWHLPLFFYRAQSLSSFLFYQQTWRYRHRWS